MPASSASSLHAESVTPAAQILFQLSFKLNLYHCPCLSSSADQRASCPRHACPYLFCESLTGWQFGGQLLLGVLCQDRLCFRSLRFLLCCFFTDILQKQARLPASLTLSFQVELTAQAHLQSCCRLHLLLSFLSLSFGQPFDSQECEEFRLVSIEIQMRSVPFFLVSHSSLKQILCCALKENQAEPPCFLHLLFHPYMPKTFSTWPIFS